LTDIFDERRRALEDEYFRRKDKESLERLREAIREDAHASGAGPVTMDCPRCDGKLHADSYEEVEINRCDKCGGIWLDAGELEQIIKQETPTNRWLHAFWPGRTDEK